VRTVDECVAEMAGDATIRTSLLEHRLLAATAALYRSSPARSTRRWTRPRSTRPRRSSSSSGTSSTTTPRTTSSPTSRRTPGGLRDLQTVLWIARAAGLGRSWRELARAGLMTMGEARSVSRQERFIGALRVRLHYLSGRREDRLVFDFQSALARQLGYEDTPTRRASEQLMQRYYRAAKTVRQVNTILLQNLHARLFPFARDPVPIEGPFCAIDELLHVGSEELFQRQPSAMLDAFLLMQRHPELKGMSARTLRALWRSRGRVDAKFRRDPANREKFMALFRAPRGLTHELRRMNLYGILGAYLPPFGRIVGQMQHDLFHVYTVDEHILMVIRNLRRFTEAQHAHEYPLCSRLIADVERKEVLYLAGLFHDIAKGRGGDHSTLGSVDARRFCRAHGMASTTPTTSPGWSSST
jgi:[protein-PII] uridylyltransferase